jgi:hypothetical protein
MQLKSRIIDIILNLGIGMKSLTLLILLFLISFNVFSKTKTKSSIIGAVFLTTPLEPLDGNYGVRGGGLSFKLDQYGNDEYYTFNSKVYLQLTDNFNCEQCTSGNGQLHLNIWDFEFYDFQDDNNHGMNLGMDINLLDIHSNSGSYATVELLDTSIRSGYLIKLNGDKIILNSSLGAGGKALFVTMNKDNEKLAEVIRTARKSLTDFPGPLAFAIDAKITLSYQDLLFLMAKYEIDIDNLKYIRRHVGEVSASATPLRSISNNDTIKSLFIGVDYRDETINIGDESLRSSYTGASLGVSF